MSRGPLKFKETDLRRAVRAVSKEGLHVREVTLDLERGSITVIPCTPWSEDREQAQASSTSSSSSSGGVSEQGASPVPRA
jgi:hypothetical protein